MQATHSYVPVSRAAPERDAALPKFVADTKDWARSCRQQALEATRVTRPIS